MPSKKTQQILQEIASIKREQTDPVVLALAEATEDLLATLDEAITKADGAIDTMIIRLKGEKK